MIAPVARTTAAAAVALPLIARRSFASSAVRGQIAQATQPNVRKPVGAFRGGLFGFLLGSTVAGGLAYYYIYDEYKVANELLTEDINALRAIIGRVDIHVRDLEEKIADQAAALAKVRK
ncbi:hypothetical protein EX30DRAFT_370539 [Ascodesmis nigricans]|uniref:Uncharacterized protein n=1 Tax=Ascodesmis nigricans TaxID=341454 RepID=A0A4S2N0K3_9PEZI|nr:hypothetical protein EX30DRAFT_370539 [Ascodesmis nigricans]